MITLVLLTEFLGWASVINIAFLLLSTIMVIAMRETIIRIHAKLFGLDDKELPKIYFQYLGNYKIVILAFNIAPYLALKLMA